MDDPKEWIEGYKREIFTALKDNGITSCYQINCGIDKARATVGVFLPDPAQFCEWCKPDTNAFGLPSSEQAFKEARVAVATYVKSRKWSHIAVHKSAIDIGFFDLKNIQDDEIAKLRALKNRFAEIYQGYVAKIMAGESLVMSESRGISLDDNTVYSAQDSQAARNNLKEMCNELRKQ